MHDKYVRRRRAALAALVAVSLILLTAYFGEAENSPLHSVQQGIVEVFTPIQDGASKVLSPVRDLSNWVSSTLHAKTRNKELEAIVAADQRKLAQAGVALAENQRLVSMMKLTDQLPLGQDGPVYANVTTYDPSVWYESAKIDKGTADGIREGDPVLSARGLVGDISSAGPNYAFIAELSAPKFAVYAQILDPSGKGGIGTLGPSVGDPTTLEVQFLPPGATAAPGDQVVTASFTDPRNRSIRSPYPPGIPIGTVSESFDVNQLQTNGTLRVSPAVDLRDLGQVEVLTHVRT